MTELNSQTMFALNSQMTFRLIIWLTFVVVTMTLVLVGSAVGSVFQKGDNVTISNVHVIDDDLYISTTNLKVEGTVNGDLTGFAYDARIQGHVSKAVNIFARSLTHSGRCEGPLRAFTEMLQIDGSVGGSVVTMCRAVNLNKGAVVEHDFWAMAQTVSLDGVIKGKATIHGKDVTITGQIGGDVEVECEHLFIKPPAVITGNLTYDSKSPAEIDTAGVTIVGAIKQGITQAKEEKKDTSVISSIATRIAGLCAAFLFGLLVIRLFRPYAEASYNQFITRFGMSVAAGLLILALIVVCVIVLSMTVLTGIAGQILISSGQTGAAFGIILMVFSILTLPIASFSALSGTILFYTGRVIMALFLGALIVRKTAKPSTLPGSLAMFIGLFILTLVFAIPVLGTILYLLVASVGAGSIVLGIRQCRLGMKKTTDNTLSIGQ